MPPGKMPGSPAGKMPALRGGWRASEIGFTSGPALANSVPVMDKFWSICTMPIGVLLVGLPAAVVWWLVDRKKPHPDDVAKATVKKKS